MFINCAGNRFQAFWVGGRRRHSRGSEIQVGAGRTVFFYTERVSVLQEINSRKAVVRFSTDICQVMQHASYVWCIFYYWEYFWWLWHLKGLALFQDSVRVRIGHSFGLSVWEGLRSPGCCSQCSRYVGSHSDLLFLCKFPVPLNTFWEKYL